MRGHHGRYDSGVQFLRVLSMLEILQEPSSTGELVDRLGVHRRQVCRELAILRKAGLVHTVSPSGRENDTQRRHLATHRLMPLKRR